MSSKFLSSNIKNVYFTPSTNNYRSNLKEKILKEK